MALKEWGLEVSELESSVVSIGHSDVAVQVHNELGLEWNKDDVNVLGHLIGSKDVYVESEHAGERPAATTRYRQLHDKQATFHLLQQSFTMKVQQRNKLGRRSIEIEEYAAGFDAMVEVLGSLIGKPTFQWARQAQLGLKEGGLALRPKRGAASPSGYMGECESCSAWQQPVRAQCQRKGLTEKTAN